MADRRSVDPVVGLLCLAIETELRQHLAWAVHDAELRLGLELPPCQCHEGSKRSCGAPAGSMDQRCGQCRRWCPSPAEILQRQLDLDRRAVQIRAHERIALSVLRPAAINIAVVS